ncbi:hypothetical protein POM88_009116 [Heracleum sosnowskyi]|uniref:Uncharacterized protein n=1 Tax=Heracleum sosnowskyi TaxID=360622 RepID=A0AAD8JA18_9APIA|nr:hypothetical protein POM88_009116 [Heracleum sosnowskyi]
MKEMIEESPRDVAEESSIERFCDKLFDEPLKTIAKPYGFFMKAPNCWNNRQIGARCLRDNMAQPLDNGGMTEIIGGKIGKSGIQGILTGDARIIAEKTDAGNNDEVQNEWLTFTDTKRRRTEENKEIDQMNRVMGQSSTIKNIGPI